MVASTVARRAGRDRLGALLCWQLGRIAQRRLETHGPELFSQVRIAAI